MSDAPSRFSPDPQLLYTPRPAPRPRYWLHLLLFLVTLGTTFLVYGAGYAGCVVLILLSHEMGHYLTCRYYRVEASLPYFLPGPPLISLGTFGAVIRIRAPFPTRTACFDIGAAGPLAGMVVAVPILIWGILTSPIGTVEGHPGLLLGAPLLMNGLTALLRDPIPEGHHLIVNGPAFAGWVGLLVTFLNLLPAGQLDGGHCLYALFPRHHRRLSRWMVAACAGFGVLGLIGALPPVAWLPDPVYPLARFFGPAWLVWAGLVGFLLRFPHPPPLDPTVPLGAGRRWVAGLLLLIFLASSIPNPIQMTAP